MAIKYRNGTGGSRHTSIVDRSEVAKGTGVKGLTFSQKNKAGRNRSGQIVSRGRGGGVARRLRQLQLIQSVEGPNRILRLEYDPTRSSWLALLSNDKGELFYRRAPGHTSAGDWMDVWESTEEAVRRSPWRYTTEQTVPRYRTDGKVTLPMKLMRPGMMVHDIEREPGKGPKYCRSAGTRARVYRAPEKEGYMYIQLPSGEVRFMSEECRATYGITSVLGHKLVTLGKAGRRRLKGFRPKVRGVAKNPVDHPHGGGEGRSSGGRHSVTPQGKRTHWNPTRSLKKKQKDHLLIKPRPRKGSVNVPRKKK